METAKTSKVPYKFATLALLGVGEKLPPRVPP